jgi:hypothetical protein
MNIIREESERLTKEAEAKIAKEYQALAKKVQQIERNINNKLKLVKAP